MKKMNKYRIEVDDENINLIENDRIHYPINWYRDDKNNLEVMYLKLHGRYLKLFKFIARELEYDITTISYMIFMVARKFDFDTIQQIIESYDGSEVINRDPFKYISIDEEYIDIRFIDGIEITENDNNIDIYVLNYQFEYKQAVDRFINTLLHENTIDYEMEYSNNFINYMIEVKNIRKYKHLLDNCRYLVFKYKE